MQKESISGSVTSGDLMFLVVLLLQRCETDSLQNLVLSELILAESQEHQHFNWWTVKKLIKFNIKDVFLAS